MKLNKLFMGFLGALALTACSSEDVVVPDNGGTVGEGEPRYMSVTIRNANPGTRAGGDQEDGELTDSKYEEGFTEENKVNSLRFYFFDAEGNAAKVAFDGHSYYDCPAEDTKVNDNMPNVEKILNAVIVIDGKKTDEFDRNKLNQIVALVNFKNEAGKSYDAALDADLSLVDLMSKINSEAAAKANGFLMTSSSFYADKYGTATQIKPEDIKSTKELAMANPVDIYVERVLAKVRVTAPWSDVDDADKKSVTWNGKTCTAVALYDKNGNAIRNGNTPDADQIYVIIDNWQLWWTADKSYLFKKVGDWDQTLAWKWNHANYHRSYWAENPKDVELAKHSHLYAELPVGYDKSEYEKYTAYCLENAADFENGGLKKWYDPNSTTSNRTLVYLSANLVTFDENNLPKAVDLAEWAGYKYTKANVKTAMFAPNVNEFYFLHTEENVNDPVVDKDGNIIESGNSSYKFISLREEDVELVTGLASGNAADDKENSKRYLSYLQLVPEKRAEQDLLWADKTADDGKSYTVEHQMYKKDVNSDGETVYAKVSVEEVNNQLQSVGGAKIWDGGKAYYYHELQHLGKTGVDNAGKDFNYGVVRNHIYEVELNKVVGLGTPVLSYKDEDGNDYWEDIIPQKPDPDAFFLAARINILSWRVVNNGVSLDW